MNRIEPLDFKDKNNDNNNKIDRRDSKDNVKSESLPPLPSQLHPIKHNKADSMDQPQPRITGSIFSALQKDSPFAIKPEIEDRRDSFQKLVGEGFERSNNNYTDENSDEFINTKFKSSNELAPRPMTMKQFFANKISSGSNSSMQKELPKKLQKSSYFNELQLQHETSQKEPPNKIDQYFHSAKNEYDQFDYYDNLFQNQPNSYTKNINDIDADEKVVKDENQIEHSEGFFSKKSSCFINNFILLFFLQFNRLFKRKFDDIKSIKEKDLFQLPPFLTVKMLIIEWLNMYSNYREVSVNKKKQLNDDNLYPVRSILRNLIQAHLWKGILLKTLTQSVTFQTGFFLSTFLDLLKSHITCDDPKLWVVVMWLGIVTSYVFFTSLANQHANFYIAKSKAVAGQAQRGIFFDKIKKSNFVFVEELEASFISKIVFYEVDIIHEFINVVPDIISAPFALISSFIFIYSKIGWQCQPSFFFIIIVIIIMIFMNHLKMKQRKVFVRRASKRAMLLSEQINNMKIVKINSMEKFFVKKFHGLRKLEVESLRKIQNVQIVNDFFNTLTPLLSVFLTIAQYKYTHHNDHPIDSNKPADHDEIQDEQSSTTIFAIVTVFANIVPPMVNLTRVSEFSNTFIESIKGQKIMMSWVEDKKPDYIERFEVPIGAIEIEKACFFIDKVSSEKVLKSMFGHVSKEMLEKEDDSDENDLFFDNVGMMVNMSNIINKIDFREHQLHGRNNHEKQERTQVLDHIDMVIKPGQVVGQMGSNKSVINNFFLSLMGETELSTGSIKITGKMNYLSLQRSFFLETSVRENITQNEEWDQKKYEYILELCDLNLANFEDYDQVTVLEGAVNFSQDSQKKIQQSRMLYQGGDIFLFDDFFDEIDIAFRESVYTNIVINYLSGKTVLIHTLDYKIQQNTDNIYVFNDHKIESNGWFWDLLNYEDDSVFFKLLKHGLGNDKQKQTKLGILLDKFNNKLQRGKGSIISHQVKSEEVKKMLDKLKDCQSTTLKKAYKNFSNYHYKPGKLQHDELLKDEIFDRSKDTGTLRSMFKYVTPNTKTKCSFVLIVLPFAIFCTISVLMSDIWLGLWASKNNQKIKIVGNDFQIGYLCIAVASSVFFIFFDMFYRRNVVNNTTKLYLDTIDTIIYVKLRWFLQVSTSKILYRLVRDQTIIDNNLMHSSQAVVESFLYIVGTFIILGILSAGVLSVFTGGCIIFLFMTNMKFIMFSGVFQLLAAKQKSKLISVYLQAVTGAVVMRNFDKAYYFNEVFYRASDLYQAAHTHMANYVQRWLGIRIAITSTLTVMFSYTYCIFALKIFPDFFLTNYFQLALCLSWTHKLLARLKLYMVEAHNTKVSLLSLERIVQYKLIAKENKLVADTHDSKINFDDSSVSIKNATLKFGNDEPVLKRQNMEIPKYSRCAIIGRSGSGKHSVFSLIQSQYRRKNMVNDKFADSNQENMKDMKSNYVDSNNNAIGNDKEDDGEMKSQKEYKDKKSSIKNTSDYCNSHIRVFGVGIESIDPFILRQNVLYLPQYPVLFSGTLRDNIDPYHRYEDMILVKTLHYLKICELWDMMVEQFTDTEKSFVHVEESFQFGKSDNKSQAFAKKDETIYNQIKDTLGKNFFQNAAFKQMKNEVQGKMAKQHFKALLDQQDKKSLTSGRKSGFSQQLGLVDHLKSVLSDKFIVHESDFISKLEQARPKKFDIRRMKKSSTIGNAGFEDKKKENVLERLEQIKKDTDRQQMAKVERSKVKKKTISLQSISDFEKVKGKPEKNIRLFLKSCQEFMNSSYDLEVAPDFNINPSQLKPTNTSQNTSSSFHINNTIRETFMEDSEYMTPKNRLNHNNYPNDGDSTPTNGNRILDSFYCKNPEQQEIDEAEDEAEDSRSRYSSSRSRGNNNNLSRSANFYDDYIEMQEVKQEQTEGKSKSQNPSEYGEFGKFTESVVEENGNVANQDSMEIGNIFHKHSSSCGDSNLHKAPSLGIGMHSVSDKENQKFYSDYEYFSGSSDKIARKSSYGNITPIHQNPSRKFSQHKNEFGKKVEELADEDNSNSETIPNKVSNRKDWKPDSIDEFFDDNIDKMVTSFEFDDKEVNLPKMKIQGLDNSPLYGKGKDHNTTTKNRQIHNLNLGILDESNETDSLQPNTIRTDDSFGNLCAMPLSPPPICIGENGYFNDSQRKEVDYVDNDQERIVEPSKTMAILDGIPVQQLRKNNFMDNPSASIDAHVHKDKFSEMASNFRKKQGVPNFVHRESNLVESDTKIGQQDSIKITPYKEDSSKVMLLDFLKINNINNGITSSFKTKFRQALDEEDSVADSNKAKNKLRQQSSNLTAKSKLDVKDLSSSDDSQSYSEDEDEPQDNNQPIYRKCGKKLEVPEDCGNRRRVSADFLKSQLHDINTDIESKRKITKSKLKKNIESDNDSIELEEVNNGVFLKKLNEEYSGQNKVEYLNFKAEPNFYDNDPSTEQIKKINEFLDKKITKGLNEISQSEKKIVMAARAFIEKPRILLMDERAIDVPGIDNDILFNRIFKNLSDTTIVSVLNRYDSLNLFDKVFIMEEGNVIEDGIPMELLSNPYSNLKQVIAKTDPKLFKLLVSGMKSTRTSKNKTTFTKLSNEKNENILLKLIKGNSKKNKQNQGDHVSRNLMKMTSF